MNLLDSLLDAIVRLDGDALVMHVGEKPYVVTTSEATNEFRGPLAWGQVELSSRVLTPEAVNGMLGQILPIDQRAALNEFGATEFQVTSATDASERFTIVAARGGDDIWLEVRRRPKRDLDTVVAAAPADLPLPASAPEDTVMAAAAAASDPLPLSPVGPAPQTIDEPAVDPAHDATDHEERRGEPAMDDEFDQEIGHAVEAPVDDTLVAVPSASRQPLAEQEALDEAAEVMAADRDWTDDVMTEGELGELLRASAAAMILGETEDAAESSHEPHVDVESMLLAEAAAEDVSAAEPQTAAALTPAEEALMAARAAFMAAQAQSADETAESVSSGSEFESPQEPVVEQAMAEAPVEEVGAIAHPEPAAPMSIEHVSEDTHPADTAAEASPAVAPEFAAMAEEEPTQPSEPAFTAAVPEEPAMPDDSRQDLSTDDTPLVLEPPAASVAPDAPAMGEQDEEGAAPARHAAVVLPLTRQSRGEGTSDARGGVAATLQRLLRLAAARGAVTVYAVAQSAPMVRIDGEFSVLEGEPTLSTAFVEKLLAELAPPSREGAATAAEWIAEVPEIGRVRCVTFRDHRGPGVIFRMVPPRAISAEQLGLPAEVQALCTEADGIVLVAGGRGSGRSTLLTSFVDLLNRTRSDYVITLESQIEFVHESKRSFVSQREVPGNGDALATAVRAAVREEPDVLIIEDLRTPELMALALEAAEGGRLVFGSVPAPSAVVAVERILEMFPAERREKAQATLASTLRGVVSQVLLRRLKGGRVPAREVLINTPAIAALIHEGKTSQLPAALENGRRYGMMPLAESLAALVRDGIVHPSHAQRKAPDKDQLVSVLRRDGIDAAVVERLA